MRIEGEKSCQAASFRRGFHSPRDHRLMADVDAIENPEREMQRFAERWQFFEAFANQHTAGIAADSGDFKLRDGGSLGLLFQRTLL